MALSVDCLLQALPKLFQSGRCPLGLACEFPDFCWCLTRTVSAPRLAPNGAINLCVYIVKSQDCKPQTSTSLLTFGLQFELHKLYMSVLQTLQHRLTKLLRRFSGNFSAELSTIDHAVKRYRKAQHRCVNRTLA